MLGGNGRIAHIEVRPRISKFRRHHADDGPELAIELELAADDRRIAIETRFPQPFADHDAAAPLLLRLRERTSGRQSA